MRAFVARQTSVGVLLALALFAGVQAVRPQEANAQTANAIDYVYDELHRLVAAIDPVAGTAKYSYDNAGNMTSIVRQAATVLSVLEFTPNAGSIGSSVTIFGTKFGATPALNIVKFGTKAATIISASPTQIVATVPAGAVTAKISVTTGGRTASSVANYQVVSSKTPTLTGFSPTVAAPGSIVTLSGTNFDLAPANNKLTLNLTEASVTAATATSLSATVPTHATSGKFALGTPNGNVSNGTDFFVVPPPHAVSAVEYTSRTTFGSVKSVPLSAAGKVALLIFDAVAGDRVFIKFRNGTFSGCTSVTLYSPTLASLVGACISGTADFDTRVLPATGTYAMVLSPLSAGSIDVTALSVPPDVTGAIAVGGSPVTLTIPNAGQGGNLTFDGTANQPVFISWTNNTFGCSSLIEIVKPSGTVWWAGYDCDNGHIDTTPLPETGTYTIRWNPGSSLTGSVSFQIYSVPPDVSGVISVGGSAVTLSIPNVGQNGSLTFSGTQNQRVAINMTSNTFGCSSYIEILNPSGSLWHSAYDCDTHYIDAALLPETGTYKIRWDPGGTLTGSVNIQIHSVPPDASSAISIGGSPVTLSIPNVGQNGSLTFSGTQNQRVAFNVTNNSFGCSSLVEIMRPSGGPAWLGAWTCDTKFFDATLLPETGQYTIRWDPAGSITGSVTFQVHSVPPDVTDTITIGGPAVTLSIPNVGQNGSLTFSGAQGEAAASSWTNNTFGCSSLIEIVKPSGTVWKSAWDCDNGSFATDTLPEAGAYTIRWNPAGTSTGSIQFQISSSGGLSNPQKEEPAQGTPAPENASPSPSPQPSPTPTPTSPSTPTPTPTPSGGRVSAASGEIDARSLSTSSRAATPEPTELEMAALWVKGLAPLGEEEWTPDLSKNAWSTDRPASPWETIPLSYAPPGVTALAGRALTLNGGPLANVTLEIDGHHTMTDSLGRFLLSDLPYGHHELHIDGRSANRRGKSYGTYEVGAYLVRGETKVLPYTIWMSTIDTANAIRISSPSKKGTVLSTPKIPGLQVRLQPGTTITDEDGEVVTEVSITPVPLDRPPYPMYQGGPFPIYYTLQPGGAYLDKGATVIYPNSGHQPAGTRVDFLYYEAGEGWEGYGKGTVSPDGRSVVPDDGVVVYEFTGNSIVYFLQELLGTVFDVLDLLASLAGDPVSLGTGLFHYEKTDLSLADTIPIALTRSYRQLDTKSRAFGIGASHPYEMFLRSSNPYQEADLVFHEGSNLHYVRTSPGTAKEDAVMEATATPTPFYKSRLTWNGSGFTVTLRDGSYFAFGAKGALQAAGDRFGNQVTILYVSGVSGNISKIRSPNGRWIDFVYDGATNRIKEAKDNLGRKIEYTYDPSGRLETVKDAKGGITRYAYNAAHQMTTITDPRNTLYLRNDYYPDGKVQKQTLPDGSTYEFTYNLGANGKVTQADVKDPRGNIRRATFNADGFLVSDTVALGKPEEQSVSYQRDAGTQFIRSSTDFLSRRTDFDYDALGNMVSSTRLAGTAESVTTSFTYEPTFSQIKTVTDPLQHTTEFFYRANGTLERVEDPLDHATTYDFYPDGQVKTVTDAKQKTTTFFYDRGDLVRVQDPLGKSVTRFADVGGRVVSSTDQLGSVSRIEYDSMNLQTKSVDALGLETRFEYDENSNLKKLYDQKNNLTQYTYNAFDLVQTRTDPLLKAESFEYDSLGNLTKSVDRKGQVSRFTYDALNRPTFAGFKETLPGPTYESTITNTYDDENQLVTVADSQSGTIQRNLDDLDRLSSETTPQGSISYTYDDADRPDTMTVAGLPLVDYTFDNANRLTKIAKGTQIVEFGYDEVNRRTLLKLPGTVSANYAYDDASRLTGITYKKDTATLGDIGYGYDASGRRTKATGTWARTALPVAVASMTYNAGNRMITKGASSLVYDDNGNLTADSLSTYTWNARDQLVSTSGAAALSYAYDGLGRRIRKTIGSTTTEFIYDGEQITAEKQNGQISTTLVTGLGIDEVFIRNASDGLRSLLPDALGSTVALSDAAGAVPTSYTYEPFGKTTTTGTANSNPYQFTGREADSSGFYYYRARFYAAGLSRFISEDPLGFGGGDTNLYAYVGNSPLNFTDPSGTCVVGALIGGAEAMAKKKGFWGVLRAMAAGCAMDLATAGLGKALRLFKSYGDEGLGLLDDLGKCAVNSFTPETRVLMGDGTTKPIAEVRVGDMVLAADPETGERGPRRVTATIVGEGEKQLVDIDIDGYIVTATAGHPFWVDDEGRWTDAEDLIVGDQVQLAEGGWTQVDAVSKRNEVRRVHNLTIDGIHTYHVMAGSSAVLVHNCRGLWGITKEGTERTLSHPGFGKLFKSKSDGTWWTKDLSGHGGSAWKVYKETGQGLEWMADADKYGDYILGKHKGPAGSFLPWKELHG